MTLLSPGESLSIFISNEWIHIQNRKQNRQSLTIRFNQTDLFLLNEYSLATHLLVGLNRNINGKQTGIGICLANLTFIECHTDRRMLTQEHSI